MNKLTIEEKAKLYDKALEKARQLCVYPTSKPFISDLQDLFPELKQDGEEKIRKWLIAQLELKSDVHNPHDLELMILESIDWLEKQGKQEEPQVYVTADGDIITYSETEGYAVIEPKFHKGDWIACEELNTAKIINIVDDKYEVEFIDGNKGFPHIEYIDRNFHLWTIEDAKAGDVLAVTMYPEGTWIGIFKEQNGCTFSSYCFVNTKGIFKHGTHGHGNGEAIHPATKEQRNILFTKMEEAGYTFNFKEKKLKGLEKEIEISFGARDSELQEATYFIPKGFHAEIDDNKVVIKKGEKPTAWSEEDEEMFDYALDMIEWYSCINWDKSSFVSDWLKSLKDKIRLEA